MGSITPTPGSQNQITRNTEVIRTTGDLKIVLSDADTSISLDTNLGSKIVLGVTGITIDAPVAASGSSRASSPFPRDLSTLMPAS